MSGRTFDLFSTPQTVVVIFPSVSFFSIIAVKNVLESSVVLRTRWVELPLDVLFNQNFSQSLLIPIGDVVQQFVFTGNKVRFVVGPDNGSNASAEDKPFNSLRTTTSVH